MDIGGYRLVTPLGAGRDGVAYQAQSAGDSGAVELVVLAEAAADRDRWKGLTKRLNLAVGLDHPTARSVRTWKAYHVPPYLVLEAVGPTSFGEDLKGRVPLS